LGDGRNGDKNAEKKVTIKTKAEMQDAIKVIRDTTEVQMPMQNTDLQIKYQLLFEQYQSLFDKIVHQEGLYTRKYGINPFHSNDQTKVLTYTQLMHISYLKSLFIDEVKSLIKDPKADIKLIDCIKDNINKKEHFINFNRTRYGLFMKQTTTSKGILISELDKTCLQMSGENDDTRQKIVPPSSTP
jgi:hypothetical protein